MPSKSQAQHDTMNAAAHSKEFADKVNIPQEVAKEYVKADKEAGVFQTPAKSEEKKK